MKKLISYAACLIIILCSASSVFAVNYTTDRFYTYIYLEEDSSMHIEELIDVNFETPGHGIYRYVYKSGKCYYEKDGKMVEADMFYTLDNFSCGEYEVYVDETSYEDSVMVRIGSADVLLEGDQDFWLEYDVEMYNDRNEEMDQFYWNVIPLYWETEINRPGTKITFPKSIEGYPVDVIAGPVGSGDESDCEWSLDDDGVSLYAWCNRPLSSGEGMTVRVILPEGYWVGARDDTGAAYLSASFSAFAALIYYIIWLIKGKDPKAIQTVEFYPPEGLTPAEVDYVLDNKESEKGIIAMLLWFAAEGYLKIKQEKGEFILTKLKDLPDNAPRYQVKLFSGLFNRSHTCSTAKLPAGFADAFAESKSSVEKVFKSIDGEDSLLVKENSKLGCLGCFPLAYAFMMAGAAFYMHGTSLATRIIAPALSAVFGILILIMMVNMSKPTTRGAQLKARLAGFKDFIERAELDPINRLVEEDPQYFYKILPYAYVFGLTDKWISNFEGLAMAEPDWYGGSSFSSRSFMTSYSSRVPDSIESSRYESYKSSYSGSSSWGGSYHSSSGSSSYSSGSSSSHGGRSGGGGGGGGGGAW